MRERWSEQHQGPTHVKGRNLESRALATVISLCRSHHSSHHGETRRGEVTGPSDLGDAVRSDVRGRGRRDRGVCGPCHDRGRDDRGHDRGLDRGRDGRGDRGRDGRDGRGDGGPGRPCGRGRAFSTTTTTRAGGPPSKKKKTPWSSSSSTLQPPRPWTTTRPLMTTRRARRHCRRPRWEAPTRPRRELSRSTRRRASSRSPWPIRRPRRHRQQQHPKKKQHTY
mmetsp:Transcript_21949/g.87122  ORF Transcript_21949/g.87122 Transcript_21949/m.87122 type:complete len:223 (-) Transcript_21949:251-919(-)